MQIKLKGCGLSPPKNNSEPRMAIVIIGRKAEGQRTCAPRSVYVSSCCLESLTKTPSQAACIQYPEGSCIFEVLKRQPEYFSESGHWNLHLCLAFTCQRAIQFLLAIDYRLFIYRQTPPLWPATQVQLFAVASKVYENTLVKVDCTTHVASMRKPEF